MSKDISDLRDHLFTALDGLADKQNPMEIERARAIADVAQTIINSAKVEVDRMKISGGIDTGFLAGHIKRLANKTPEADTDVVEKGAGYTVRQHRLKG